MKVFFRWVLPALIAVAVLIEGISYGLRLTNVSDDAAVFGGTVLALFTVAAFVSFIVAFFVKPILRRFQ